MTRGLVVAGVIVSALAGGACSPAVPAVPGQGGPAWVELTSPHFTLWTDASVGRGRRLLGEMEHLRQVVYGMAFADLPSGGTSFAVALRDAYEVGAYVPSQFIAYAWASPVLRQPMIVFAADTDDSDGHVIAHELTHMISWGAVHHQPAWFAEGMAKFFETVQLDARRRVVDVGEPLPGMLAALGRLRLKRAAEVMRCHEDVCKDHRFYVTAWAMYAFLANTRGADLVRYQARLDQVDDPDQAWREAFPDLPVAKLDAAVREWLLHGRRTVWHFTVDLREPRITERVITDAEVYAVRAVLRYAHAPAHPQIARDIGAALALEPTNPLARTMDAMLGHLPSVDDARAMTEAHGDDWRAWWLLASVLGGEGAEAEAALRQVCELASANPAVWSPWRCAEP